MNKLSDKHLKIAYGGDFPVEIDCTLDGKQILFKPAIKNASKDLILREFQFPFIKNLAFPEKYGVIWSYSGGSYAHRNMRDWVGRTNHVTLYMAEDYNAFERCEVYPGKRKHYMPQVTTNPFKRHCIFLGGGQFLENLRAK